MQFCFSCIESEIYLQYLFDFYTAHLSTKAILGGSQHSETTDNAFKKTEHNNYTKNQIRLIKSGTQNSME